MKDDLEYKLRTEMNHEAQVEKFGWCICEGTGGEGQLAEDCPEGEAKV